MDVMSSSATAAAARSSAADGPYIATSDGVSIYYKDWGPKDGQPIVFSHGWPLSADAWEDQTLFLSSEGYRTIAHDRRGNGRSSQPWGGHDMDHFADDLRAVVEALDLRHAIHVGHSTGGGEVARYLGRHGSDRAAKAVLIGAVPPIMIKTDWHPMGLPIEAFDGIRKSVHDDRSQFFYDLSIPFYGFNRDGAKVSEGLRESFRVQGLMGSIKAEYDCVKAFSETDFRDDLAKIDIPVLVMHGDDDQIVPIDGAARVTAQMIKGAQLKVYPGAPHGLCSTMKDTINRDLLAFIES